MRRRRALNGVDRDIRDHIERETEDNLARGLPAGEARRQALLAFGNVVLVQEDTRAVWTWIWAEQILQDIRYALRTLRRNPSFAAVVIVTLALGIGMNTAVFSVFNALLVRPITYPDTDRLVYVSLHGDIPFNAIPLQEFRAWQSRATSFDGLIAYENTQDHALQTTENGTQVRNVWVSNDFWALSGARTALGRVPAADEADVMVLSHGLFERWFHSDPGVIGRTVTLNGRQVAIIGVLTPDFRFQLPQEALGPVLEAKLIDIYRPYPNDTPQDGGNRSSGIPVRVVGKLKQGLTIEQAHAELEAIRGGLARARPDLRLDRGVLRIVPLHEKLVAEIRPALWTLLAAVALVLLIACANIGSLQLARASARQRELAVRVSLGAGRARVLRQLLSESIVLAILGGAAGLIVARVGVNMIVRLVPPEVMPRLMDVAVDGRVLLFTVGTSLVTAGLFGIIPAAVVWSVQPRDAARVSSRSASAARASLRGRSALVAAELALAVVLLSAAGLMGKSFWRMHEHPPGFDPERILTLKVMFTPPTYLDPVRRVSYVDEALRRIAPAPGVDAAGVTAVGGASPLVHVVAAGSRQPIDSERQATTHLSATSAGYARAMGLQVLRGRWFSEDEPSAAVVISESVARREFGDDDPIGRLIQLTPAAAPGAPPASPVPIVGVVSDLRYSRLDRPPDPQIFIPYRHYSRGFARFTAVIRTAGDPRAVGADVRSRILEIDPTLPIFDVMTMDQTLADSIAPRRLNVFLLGTFATAALLLALIGIYGVMSYAVVQRTPEIGVRMALGAQPAEVVRMVVRQGMWVVAVGIVAGLVGALALTTMIAGLLYDVQPHDLPTFGAVTAVLMATAFIACCGPARTAARIDPVVALRYE
jgi:putative ABC transport system permease protein